MDAILARIIYYLNGCMFYDARYKILKWFFDHYMEMEEDSFNLENVIKDTGTSEEDVMNVLEGLDLERDFDKFKEILWQSQSVRLDQIRGRMIGLSLDDIMADMEKSESNEELKTKIEEFCDCLDKSDRIFLIGAYYPLSIAEEFQTDMNTFGKKVEHYQSFDKTLKFNEKDMLIFISATGRSLGYFMASKTEQNPQAAKSLLITQNKQYLDSEFKVSDFTLVLPGRYDGININYQIMKVFDLLRLSYYQRYFM